MEKIPVNESSFIEAIEYDDFARILTIRFASGRVYQYGNVPPHMVRALRNSASKGRFFNHHVRGYYDSREIGDLHLGSELVEGSREPIWRY